MQKKGAIRLTTRSILVQTLCVPCACHCRYCLLSWDGKPVGADMERAAAFTSRLRAWAEEARPGVPVSFSFGYSMEMPDPAATLGLLRTLGSPQSEFLQCDGMAMRDEAACAALCGTLRSEGVKSLNFTLYGLEAAHDRFAGRAGDFQLILRMMRAAKAAGLRVSAGIALTGESAPEADALIRILDGTSACDHVRLFVPHEEGRGALLNGIRFGDDDIRHLSDRALSLIDRTVYRAERDWLRDGFTPEDSRMLLISLRGDNIDRYEAIGPGAVVDEVEGLDEAYYAAFPTPEELGRRYGDPAGARWYSQRDLKRHYRQLYARDAGLTVYDVTDERFSGSRRYQKT